MSYLCIIIQNLCLNLMPHKTYKIILVDDQPIFRGGLKLFLENELGHTVIAEASSGKEFLELPNITKSDIIIMEMPELTGVEAAEIATKKYPQLKILVFSMFGNEVYHQKMISAGAKGFVLKTSDIYELKKAIIDVANGECHFPNGLLHRIILNIGKDHDSTKTKNSSRNILSKREHEILSHVCIGLSTDKIAEKLHLSPKTVKGYRTKILSKTGCNNTASLVMYSIKNKLVDIN